MSLVLIRQVKRDIIISITLIIDPTTLWLLKQQKGEELILN